jgi:hypothetical protein
MARMKVPIAEAVKISGLDDLFDSGAGRDYSPG